MAKARIAPVRPGVYLKELLEELRLSQYQIGCNEPNLLRLAHQPSRISDSLWVL